LVPAFEGRGPQVIETFAVYCCRVIDFSIFQTRQGGDDLEGRTGWVLTGQSLVLQGVALVVKIFLPFGRRHFTAEQRGIESGIADKGQYFSGIYINGNS